MRIAKFIFYVLLLVGLSSCGAKANKEVASEHSEQNSMADNTDAANIDLLNAVYNKFVFMVGSDGLNPEEYFTPNAMKKLQEAYGFDKADGSHYAYYGLRTGAQDSKPGVDDVSKIYGIESAGDGWYVVSYSDMGWPGKTRIRIVDGKIDEFERLEQ